MSSPITATIDPEKLRAILSTFPTKRSFRVFIRAHSDCVEPVHETLLSGILIGSANSVCVKRISGGRGKGQDAESAWHLLLHPSLPSRQTLKHLSV